MSLRSLIMGSSGTYIPDTSVKSLDKLTFPSGSRLWKGMTYGKFENLTNADGSLKYPNGVFATVAYGTAKAAYSLDNTQTFIETPIPNNVPTVTNPYGGSNWNDIAYGKRNGVNAFIAVVYNTSSYGVINKAAWSNDGITWNYFTFPTTSLWSSIHYQNDMWIVLGTTTALISSDGVNWTTITGLRSATWKGCTYIKHPNGTEKLIITGNAASFGAVQALVKQVNGTWSPQTASNWSSASGGAMRLTQSATDNNGKIIVGGLDGNTGLISTDYGDSFNMLQLPTTSTAIQQYEAVLYADGIWMMFSLYGIAHSSSGDPGKWGFYKPPSSIGVVYDGVYANGRFVMSGNSVITTVTF